MSLSIPNTTATTRYVTWGGGSVYDRGGYLFVGNGPIDIILSKGRSPSLAWDEGPFTLTSGPVMLDPAGPDGVGIIAVQLRAAGGTLTSPAQQYYGGLFNGSGVSAGQPFVGTLSTSGTISPPLAVINGVTGSVSAAGAVLAGTGFTAVKINTGEYTITFTPALAANPLVLVTPLAGVANQDNTVPINTGFNVLTFNPTTGASADRQFDFVALLPQ